MSERSAAPGALIGLGAAAAVLTAFAATGGGGGRSATPAQPPAVRQAIGLAAQGDRLRLMGPGLSPAAARAMARERARAIPLPAGGNFNGVQWPSAPDPAATPAELEQVLQHNARCQWMRAQAAGRQPAVAEQVLAASARWPAFAREGAVTKSDLLLMCVASHREEVAYAEARGFVPSA
jgi:hypothetical protein